MMELVTNADYVLHQVKAIIIVATIVIGIMIMRWKGYI